MNPFRFSQYAVASVLLMSLAGPAMAYKWPGEGPSIGGAISAKAIGKHCNGVLSATEVAEFDAFLTKAAADYAAVEQEKAAKKLGYIPLSLETITAGLSKDYDNKYRDGQACDTDASEEARDMLKRVRKMMAAGGAIYARPSDPNRLPGTIEVINARIVGEKCEGTLSALEITQLELYLAKARVRFARNATDGDTRVMREHEMSAEKAIDKDFQPAKDCGKDAVAEAKDTAARVSRIEAAAAK
jgi:hypothetical protein